jgi:colanic acid biosynthesis glycosyl transferase WcaI
VIVSPPLFVGIPIALLARLKGSRTVFHVQDLQPDAAVELGMLKPGRLTRLFYRLERITYRLCDRVSTVGFGMLRRIAAKGVPENKLILFRNWANDDQVTPLSRETKLRQEWNLGDRFVVLYSGNLGVKQGLGSLLDCARQTRERKDIAYVIVGDGGEKAELMRAATEMGLDNVQFHPLQPLDRLSELLATADVSVIPQKAGTRDVVMPSKLGNILGSARAVVVAAPPDSELGRIVGLADCGVLVPPGEGEAMAKTILQLEADGERREQLGRNGRTYMEQHLGHTTILNNFAGKLEALVPTWPLVPATEERRGR